MVYLDVGLNAPIQYFLPLVSFAMSKKPNPGTQPQDRPHIDDLQQESPRDQGGWGDLSNVNISKLAARLNVAPDIVAHSIHEVEITQAKNQSKREKTAPQKLTEKVVKNAKPRMKEYAINSDLAGFQLRVRPSGEKRYVVVYKTPGARFRRYTIGNPAELSVKDAYQRALEVIVQFRSGEDPQAHKRELRNFTLNDMFREYVEHQVRPNLSPSWGREIERMFSTYVERDIGGYGVAQLTRRDLMTCVEQGTTHHVKHKIKAVLSAFYTWAVSAGLVDQNPLTGTGRVVRPRSRERYLDDHEIWAVWQATYKLNEPWGPFGRLLMMTGARRGEVAGMQWSEINFDRSIWTIPLERTKNRRGHIVPLTKLMVDCIQSMPDHGSFVFESPRVAGQPIVGFSKSAEKWKKEAKLYDWRVHDLRRTVATSMGKIGISPHVIEAVLAHSSGVISGVAAVYNRHEYEDEKRAALIQWNQYLVEVISTDFQPFEDPDEAVVL